MKRRQLWAALSLLALAAAAGLVYAASRSYSSSTDRYFDPADYPGPTVTQVFPDQLPPLPESGPYYLRVHDFAFRSGGLVYDGVSLRQSSSRDGGQLLYVYDMDQMDIAFAWLAAGYVQEQADAHSGQPVTVSGWPAAYLCRWPTEDGTDEYQQLLLLDTRTVWSVLYTGPDDLSAALDVFAK